MTGKGAHTFQAYTYLRPVKCDHCFEKVWGTESRCSACNYHCHTRCAEEVPQNCTSGLEVPEGVMVLPKVAMFGRDLQEQLYLESRGFPVLIEKCSEAVEYRGLEMEGIYRKSGPISQLREIMTALSRDEQPDMLSDQYDVTTVTSLLKLYLRELPNPVITYELYPKFIEVMEMRELEERIAEIRHLLALLPPTHKTTLKYVVEHLYRVQEYASFNQMTSKNLSLVFGPALIRALDADNEFFDMVTKNALVCFIIEHYHVLFD